VDEVGLITYTTIGQSDLRKMESYDDVNWTHPFIDENTSKSHTYRYAVRVVWEYGKTSKQSDEKEILL
jgi:hypothetical protein